MSRLFLHPQFRFSNFGPPAAWPTDPCALCFALSTKLDGLLIVQILYKLAASSSGRLGTFPNALACRVCFPRQFLRKGNGGGVADSTHAPDGGCRANFGRTSPQRAKKGVHVGQRWVAGCMRTGWDGDERWGGRKTQQQPVLEGQRESYRWRACILHVFRFFL